MKSVSIQDMLICFARPSRYLTSTIAPIVMNFYGMAYTCIARENEKI